MNRSNLLPAASNEAFNVVREKNQNRFQILLDINSRPETTIYYESIQNHLTPIMCQPNKEDKYPDEIITTYASVRLSPLASDHCFVFDASLRPPKNIDQLHLKRNKRLWMLRLVASAHGHQHSFFFFSFCCSWNELFSFSLRDISTQKTIPHYDPNHKQLDDKLIFIPIRTFL